MYLGANDPGNPGNAGGTDDELENLGLNFVRSLARGGQGGGNGGGQGAGQGGGQGVVPRRAGGYFGGDTQQDDQEAGWQQKTAWFRTLVGSLMGIL